MAKAKLLKKKWHFIVAPKLFRNVVLGETLVYEPEQMMGGMIPSSKVLPRGQAQQAKSEEKKKQQEPQQKNNPPLGV